MTTQELIERLQNLDPDGTHEVWLYINGEDGYARSVSVDSRGDVIIQNVE